jgi:hypothetical protein
MKEHRTIAIAALLAACAILAGLIASANAARVQIGPLVVVTDGGFKPQKLPRHSYAPISFWGHADIRTVHGKPPPALRHVMLEFDRDGKLTTAGLPVCQPASIENATPQEARRRCKGAIVGTGHAAATVVLPGSNSVDVESPVTLFNGPREGGNPTVIGHAQTTYPTVETYVVVAPIERRGGLYSYRTAFDVPPIAGGYGVLTHVDIKVAKRFRAGGAERSYVSARCSIGILRTHGLFYFADGNVLSGDVFRACHPIE